MRGRSMPKPCSQDLRERVLEAVEAGASRREAAEYYEISASSAIKWMQRWHATGSVAPKPSGGSVSPLEKHGRWLLALIDRKSTRLNSSHSQISYAVFCLKKNRGRRDRGGVAPAHRSRERPRGAAARAPHRR